MSLYTPSAFAWTDSDTIDAFIDRNAFASLISHSGREPRLSQLPVLLDREQRCLFAHFARANTHWQALAEAPEVSVVFNGESTYVSPSWYAEPDGVPTWNYRTVMIHGRVRILDDPDSVYAVVDGLTRKYEDRFERPWRLDSLAPQRRDAMFRAIVAVRIDIERIEAKSKMSQNRSIESQLGVIAALESSDQVGADAVAALMRTSLPGAARKQP